MISQNIFVEFIIMISQYILILAINPEKSIFKANINKCPLDLKNNDRFISGS